MITLNLFHIYFPKLKPLKISLGEFARETYLVILTYNGLKGVGGAYPFKPITGDTPKLLISEANKITNIPLNPKKDGPKKLHLFLDKKIKSKTLQAAVDSAYHDLLGKVQKVPTYKLYSKKSFSALNSVTVFLQDSMKATKLGAMNIYEQVPDLKILKIKLSGKDDLKRVKVIKEVSPTGMKFILDANQAYKDPKKAVKVLEAINKILKNVILVEQPCPKDDLKSLKYVTDNLKGMMVFADESVATFEDAKKVISKKAAHGINIKLQKAGGIYPSMQIAKLCKEHDVKIMVGAMIEDTIGLTACAHFAAANSNVVLTDLDTDLDTPKYISGGSYLGDGKRKISLRHGLGIGFDLKKLNKYKKDVVYKKLI